VAAIFPYLVFNGNCKEAFNFYKKVFGGDFNNISTFGDMPPAPDAPPMNEADKQRILHVALPIAKDLSLLGSDRPGAMQDGLAGDNVSLSVNALSEEEATALFYALAQDGKITMPIQKTFWDAYFGMCTDKFGIHWMVNYDYPKQNQFIIQKSFKASKGKIFDAFTKAEHMLHWWGPAGIQLEVKYMDAIPGGYFHYCMNLPDGNKMWGRFDYLDLQAPNSIQFISYFSDEQGGLSAGYMMPNWPPKVLNNVTISEVDGTTFMHITGWPIQANALEIETFNNQVESMQKGFAGTFAQLENYLNKMQ